MNPKLQAVIDALNELDYAELSDEELQTLDSMTYNEHLSAQRALFSRGK